MIAIANYYHFGLTGKDKNGFGFGGTGKKSYASQFDDYGEVGVAQLAVGYALLTITTGIR